MFHLKGAVSRVAEGATAFGNRQASHAVTLDGVWRPGEDFGDQDTTWTKGFFAALGPFRDGVYVNFLGRDEDPDRVREAYGDSVYNGLVDVKTPTIPTTSSTTTRTSPPLEEWCGWFRSPGRGVIGVRVRLNETGGASAAQIVLYILNCVRVGRSEGRNHRTQARRPIQ